MSIIATRMALNVYNESEDSLSLWLPKYINYLQEEKDPSNEDIQKTRRLIDRFIEFYHQQYGHDRIATIVRRDIEAWLNHLYSSPAEGGKGYAASYVNGHQNALSQMMKWLRIAAPHLIHKDPTRGIKEIMLPDPEPRTLNPQQILTLKNICDRLDRFHIKKDRRRSSDSFELKAYARPLRDRAIVYVILSTGLRRSELVNLNLDQVIPRDPDLLRQARSAKIIKVKGKGKTEGTVFLSADARQALADYIEQERCLDEDEHTIALFLSVSKNQRKGEGRLHPRSINRILEQIGVWHDAELKDESRHISPLRPHDLRHTFGNEFGRNNPEATREDLIRALRHRNDKYLTIYTKPQEATAAKFIEKM